MILGGVKAATDNAAFSHSADISLLTREIAPLAGLTRDRYHRAFFEWVLVESIKPFIPIFFCEHDYGLTELNFSGTPLFERGQCLPYAI